MKRLVCIAACLLMALFQVSAQNSIRVEAPDVVAVNEQFNVTFIIEGEKSPSDFHWSEGDDFQLVWGPQKGSSSSVSIINGKRTSSHQSTFTYILIPTQLCGVLRRHELQLLPLLLQLLHLLKGVGGFLRRSGQCLYTLYNLLLALEVTLFLFFQLLDGELPA